MNETKSCNCVVCAEEFLPADSDNIVLSRINTTNFKICEACINKCDPAEDYREAKEIINSYLRSSNNPSLLFKDALEILSSVKKEL